MPGVTWVAATGVGLIACALLVINNLRDIPTDTEVGKRTLAVRLGDRRTRWFYAALMVATFGCVVLCAVERPWSLLGLVGAAAAVKPVRVVMSGAAGGALIPVLADTGRTQLVFGAGLAIGLAIG